jgi:hypothetical protein
VACLPNLPTPGSAFPSVPPVNSPRVRSSSEASGSTSEVYRGPSMVGASGRRAPILWSLGDVL